MTKKHTASENPEPRDVLKYLLGYIYRTRNRTTQLERSLAELQDWMTAPIGGTRYTPTPRAPGHSDGVAMSTLIKMADIEDRYKAEQAEIKGAAQRVMDLVALLPIDTLERTVCEMRHIRLMAWEDIADQIPMSRRQVSRVYNGALAALLDCAEVKAAIVAATAEYKRWRAVRQYAILRRPPKNQVGG